MESILYVGMDVHKDTYSVCAYDAKNDKYLYEHKMKASSKNVVKYLNGVKEKMGDDELFRYSDFFASLYSPHSYHGRNMAFVQGGKHKLTREELSEPLRRAFAFVQNNALEHLRSEADGKDKVQRTEG